MLHDMPPDILLRIRDLLPFVDQLSLSLAAKELCSIDKRVRRRHKAGIRRRMMKNVWRFDEDRELATRSFLWMEAHSPDSVWRRMLPQPLLDICLKNFVQRRCVSEGGYSIPVERLKLAFDEHRTLAPSNLFCFERALHTLAKTRYRRTGTGREEICVGLRLK